MRKLDRVAEAIMEFEGWKPGSASYRRSNPGNLRWGQGMIAEENGYAVFATWEEGIHALVRDLYIKCSGLSKAKLPNKETLGRSHNLYDLFAVYAPAADDNHPKVYADFVADRAGIDPKAPIGNILVED